MRPACRDLMETAQLEPGRGVNLPTERARLHREHCAVCSAVVDGLEHAADAVDAAAGPRLDEITQASLLRRMEPALDDLAATYAARAERAARPRRSWRPAFAVVAVAAAVLLAVGIRDWLGGQGDQAGSAPGAVAVAEKAPAALRPYVISGALALSPAAESLLDASVRDLVVPEGARVRARVPHGDVAIEGPARLSIAPGSEAEGGYALRLRGGTLLAVVDPVRAPGDERPPIRVFTADAVVTVVGTVFMVADRGGQTEVAVTRGTVSVRKLAAGESTLVNAGQGWRHGRAGAIADAARDALEHHVASRLPPPETATRLALTDGPEGAEVRVAGTVIGTTPLIAWIESGVDIAAASAVAPAPTPVPAPAPASVPSPSPDPTPDRNQDWTVEERYDSAEAALRAGEYDEAEAHWQDLVRRYPEHALADLALYELAQLAARRGRGAEARRWVELVLRRDRDPQLREPASWLRCTLLEDRPDELVSCLEEFRAAFPQSPHAARAREWLDARGQP